VIVETYVSEDLYVEPGHTLGVLPLVFVFRKPTKIAPVCTYGVIVRTTAPGFGSPVRTRIQSFDPVSGLYLGEAGDARAASFYTTFYVFAERDGSIWFFTNFAGQAWAKYYLVEGDSKYWEDTGQRLDFGAYTPGISHPVGVDSARRVLLSCTDVGLPSGWLSVYDMDTSERVRLIHLGSHGRQILLEDDDRCFVICDGGMVLLVDYMHGRVLGIFRIAYHEDQATSQRSYAWDPFTRRILVIGLGAGQHIRGYYPMPLGVGMTPPMPLDVPRAGRTIRVATRVYGDTGEGIAGRRVTATATSTGRLRSPKAVTGATGYAVHRLRCLSAGEQTMETESYS
jgi:hypothetical protein